MTCQVDWRCDTHADRYDCPDALISFIAKWREYGLIIHDGGSSSIIISYCPWCGTRLPESQRDRWFGEMERRGIDPMSGNIPAEFRDDQWLRSEPDTRTPHQSPTNLLRVLAF
jgi:uncharacterized protein DUF6980